MAAQQLEESTVGREMAIAMIGTTMKHVIGMVAIVPLTNKYIGMNQLQLEKSGHVNSKKEAENFRY